MENVVGGLTGLMGHVTQFPPGSARNGAYGAPTCCFRLAAHTAICYR